MVPPTNTKLPLVTCGMLRLKSCGVSQSDLRSMRMPIFLSVLAFFMLGEDAQAQSRSVRDSALFSPHFHLHGGIGTSAGDLGSRFTQGGNFGMGLHVKFPSGFYTGIQADFGFGMTLIEQGVLSNSAESCRATD